MDKREKYGSMASDLVINLPGDEVTAANVVTLSGKLAQMANGAGSRVQNRKMEDGGHKTLNHLRF